MVSTKNVHYKRHRGTTSTPSVLCVSTMADLRNKPKPKPKENPHIDGILKSIAPLFYISRIMGIIPLSLFAFRKNEVKKSVTGTIWCFVAIAVNTAQYHIALNNSFNWNLGSDTNTLTAVIGIFIVYMEPLMMTVGILCNIFYQNAAMSCLNRLATVDEKLLAITGKSPSGDKVHRLSIILISASVICEVGLVLFNFVQFQISDDILLQSYWWACSGTPIFTDSIARLWYLVFIYLVKLRIEVINGYCSDLQETFKEKKDKYNQINAKIQNQTPPVLGLGYLGQEILDPKQRHHRKVHFITPNKIHVMPQKQSTDHSNPGIFMTEKDFTWNNEQTFSVDDKMDKKLIEIVRLQDELCEIAKLINKFNSFQILLTMAYGFMSVTAQLYFLYCGLVGQVIPILFRSAESLTISVLYIIYTSTKCVSIIYISWKTKVESQKTGLYLHKIANVLDENHFYHVVNHLSLKLLNNQLTLTACGFFELDMTTIYAVSRSDLGTTK